MEEKGTKKVKKTTAVAKNSTKVEAKTSAKSTKATVAKSAKATATKTTKKPVAKTAKVASKSTVKEAQAKVKEVKKDKKSPVENYLNNMGGANNAPKYTMRSTLKNEEVIKTMVSRINRVNGQLNGVKNMVESGRLCMDIMIQIYACERALVSIGDILMKEHLENCVHDEIQKHTDDVVSETMDLLKMMR